MKDRFSKFKYDDFNVEPVAGWPAVVTLNKYIKSYLQ